MATDEVPAGFVRKDDGCLCPEGDEKKEREFTGKGETCPYDPRFPNTNQTNHCFFSFIDFQRCSRLLGDYPGCKIFYQCYTALCPAAWYEKWYDQMDAGIFPRKIYPPKPIIRPDPKKMRSIVLEPEEEETSAPPFC